MHYNMEASSLPFAIPPEEVAILNASEGFQSIRRNIASQQDRSYGTRLSLAVVANLTIFIDFARTITLSAWTIAMLGSYIETSSMR